MSVGLIWDSRGMLGFFLVFLRMSGFFASFPIFARPYCPLVLQAFLSLLCAFLIAPSVPLPDAVGETMGLTALLALGARDVLIGVLLGFASLLVLVAAQVAGQYLDFQMGFFTANQVDPQSGARIPLMGNYLYMIALVLFLGLNGHHLLLQALFESFQWIPLGSPLSLEAVAHLFPMMSWMFRASLTISLPVLAALFLATVALGVLGRTMPQLNIFVLGIPLRILMGLIILMGSVTLYVNFFQGSIFERIQDLFVMIRAW